MPFCTAFCTELLGTPLGPIPAVPRNGMQSLRLLDSHMRTPDVQVTLIELDFQLADSAAYEIVGDRAANGLAQDLIGR